LIPDGIAGVTLPSASDPSLLTADPTVFETDLPGAAADSLLLLTGAPALATGAPSFTRRTRVAQLEKPVLNE
jgi:hypothetical protein